jgi:hypothetical protein
MRPWIQWLLVVCVLVLTGWSINWLSRAVDAGAAQQQKIEAVRNCKIEQYDGYQQVLKLGLQRWEASCSAAMFADAGQKPFTPGGGDLSAQIEQKCFIKLKECGGGR